VLAALVPVLAVVFRSVDDSASDKFDDALGKGELLVIAITIAIAGVAELALALRNITAKQAVWVALLLLGNLLLVASAALW
jgi:hypothetical protein